MLGLCCCKGFSLVVVRGLLSLQGLLLLWNPQALGRRGFSGCVVWAQELQFPRLQSTGSIVVVHVPRHVGS